MASPRSLVPSAPRFQPGRLVGGVGLALLLALLAGPHPAARAATLPPGAVPCFTNAVPAGYGTFVLHKSATFHQAPGAAPAISNALGQITLKSPSAFAISNAIVGVPGGSRIALAPQADGTSAWSESGTEQSLATRLPAGLWTTQFQLAFTNGDTFVGFFAFSLASNLPPIPEVLDLAAAQSLNASAPVTLGWNPWVGTTTNDRIHLQITTVAGRTVFAAASDCSADIALAPGAGSVVLPAGTLAADTAYVATLTFGASLLAAQDDGALMVQRGFQSRTTRFPLRTAPTGTGGGQPGDLQDPRISGTNLVFTLKGVAGTSYAVESTVDLSAWIREQTVVVPASGSVEVTIPVTPGEAPKFYRATSIGGTTPPPAPATLAVAFAGPDQLRVTVTGTAGATYAVEGSGTLSSWTKVADAVIPAGATSTTITIPIAPGTDFQAYRAVGTGTSTARPVPSLSIGAPVTSGNRVQFSLRLTGGEASKTYFIQVSNNLNTWGNAPQTIRTDAQGSGSTTLFSGFGSTNAAYRAFIR